MYVKKLNHVFKVKQLFYWQKNNVGFDQKYLILNLTETLSQSSSCIDCINIVDLKYWDGVKDV